MCGIAGYIDFHKKAELKTLKRMVDVIIHRGPDSNGFFVDNEVGLGFRRLSIIDLSTGDQPIFNEDESIVIILNGEIYNYQELRKDLIKKGHYFKTQSDVEVVVHLYEENGIECVKLLRGMYAFALWDKNKNSLIIGRDRTGIKPLYFFQNNEFFAFASEIKSLLQHPGINAEPDYQSIYEFLNTRFVLTPNTVFKNIQKLEPGHILQISGENIKKIKYWDFKFEPKIDLSEEEAAWELKRVFIDSLKLHIISDVPLGVYLSGGLDSTIVVAALSQMATKPIKTFNVSFGMGEPVDEDRYARIVADHFNTDHENLIVEPMSLEKLDEIIWHIEEPIVDPAIIPTYLISELAKKYVTVVLTGEGSDEINGGYRRYQIFQKDMMFKKCFQFFYPFTKYLGGKKFSNLNKILSIKNDVELIRKYATNGLSFNDSQNGRDLFNSRFLELINQKNIFEKQEKLFNHNSTKNILDKRFLFDMKSWMREDLLLKVDKMTMANSLEARVPFLDNEVINFSTSLPSEYKIRDGQTKYLLRKAFSDLLPDEILFRKQHGFIVPLQNWFNSDFTVYVKDKLNYSNIKRRQIFNPEVVESILNQHFYHKKNYTNQIWAFLMLELWFNKFID